MGNHDEMNRLIRQKLGLDEPSQDEPEPGKAQGSADGAAGTTNSRPKSSPNQRMNKALVDAWLRRRGKVG